MADKDATSPGACMSRVLKSVLLLTAFGLLAGCGVRGAPAVPPPLFGDTDQQPGVPQPYQRADQAGPPLPAALPPQPTDAPPGEAD
jgi:predicted small lipoprotein YifL